MAQVKTTTKIKVGAWITVYAYTVLGHLKGDTGLSMSAIVEAAVREYAVNHVATKKRYELKRASEEYAFEIASEVASKQ